MASIYRVFSDVPVYETPVLTPSDLSEAPSSVHLADMMNVSILTLLIRLLIPVGFAQQESGSWKLNPNRSTFSGEIPPKTLVLRIEPHPKGEMITVDQTDTAGRAISYSAVLYLDGVARPFQDDRCSGTRSSRRVDSQTVEMLCNCTNGESTRFVLRQAEQGKELILGITEQRTGGRRLEQRLVLERRYER